MILEEIELQLINYKQKLDIKAQKKKIQAEERSNKKTIKIIFLCIIVILTLPFLYFAFLLIIPFLLLWNSLRSTKKRSIERKYINLFKNDCYNWFTNEFQMSINNTCSSTVDQYIKKISYNIDQYLKGNINIENVYCLEEFKIAATRTHIFQILRYLRNNHIVKIPKYISYIPDKAFEGCIGLEKVIMDDNVVKIGSYAFCGCINLKTVVLSKNLTSIGEKAFYRCEKLIEVNIPHTVTHMGNQSFYCCRFLMYLNVSDELKKSTKLYYNRDNIEDVFITECFRCNTKLFRSYKKCGKCGGVICPNCGTCLCN